MRFFEFAPTANHPTQSAPHVFGIETQKLTDIGERENPRIVAVHEPLFGFAKPFFAGGIARAAVFSVIVNGIFENGSDQRCFGFEILAAPKGIEKLLRVRIIADSSFSSVCHISPSCFSVIYYRNHHAICMFAASEFLRLEQISWDAGKIL